MAVSGLDQLTDRQREIFDYIAESLAVRGYTPSYREIMGRFGIKSLNGVACHVRALRKKGVIMGGDGESLRVRSLRIGAGRTCRHCNGTGRVFDDESH